MESGSSKLFVATSFPTCADPRRLNRTAFKTASEASAYNRAGLKSALKHKNASTPKTVTTNVSYPGSAGPAVRMQLTGGNTKEIKKT